MPKFVPKVASICEPIEFRIGEIEYSTRITPKMLDRAIDYHNKYKAEESNVPLDDLLPVGIAQFLSDDEKKIKAHADDLRKADIRELRAVYAWIWDVINDDGGDKEAAGK